MIEVSVTKDIATCRMLRRKVFIEEQGVSEADEIDDKDDTAIHLLATVDGAPVGTARLLLMGETGKIGRVCVLQAHRGGRIGVALMRAAIAELQRHPGITHAKLSSQTHALDFYRRFGFEITGPVYDDAGIPHQDMVANL